MSGSGGRGAGPRAAPGGAGAAASAGEVEVRIDSIAAGGDGVGREATGRVVFVPRTAPGDLVVAEVRRRAAAHVRAFPLRFLERGPDRRRAPCPFYDVCGGCQLQHLGPEAQREAKRRAVADALARIGGIGLDVPAVLATGPELGYRNRVTFTLRRVAGDVVAGYHRPEGGDRLADLGDCPLAEEPVRRAWRALRAAWGPGARHLPGGRELRVTVRASVAGRVSLLVTGGEASAPGEPAAVLDAVPALEGYAWRPRGARRRTLAGSDSLAERWAGIDLALGPETFLQVNRAAAEAVDAWVDRAAGPLAGRRALELYAGVGTRAVRWARAGARVTAAEIDGEAVEAGRRAAGEAGTEVDLRAEAAERTVASLPAEPLDLVVVNPPRRGLSAEVAAALASRPAGRLVYVSCDPATLARDLRRLRPAWTPVAARAFDAFPNTAHVETAVALEPEGREGCATG